MASGRFPLAGHTLETPWTTLQLAYFAGTAMWTYPHPALPFALPGFETTELDSWPQAGEEWRRMRVVWPSCVATHSTEQTRYVGGDRLLRRHDDDVEIMGGSGAAHPLVVSIDLGEIAFT